MRVHFNIKKLKRNFRIR